MGARRVVINLIVVLFFAAAVIALHYKLSSMGRDHSSAKTDPQDEKVQASEEVLRPQKTHNIASEENAINDGPAQAANKEQASSQKTSASQSFEEPAKAKIPAPRHEPSTIHSSQRNMERQDFVRELDNEAARLEYQQLNKQQRTSTTIEARAPKKMPKSDYYVPYE